MRWLDALIALFKAKQSEPEPPAPPEPVTIDQGWLVGDGIVHVPMHTSWRYPDLHTPDGTPRAVVAHYSATNPGTAMNMARRRAVPRTPEDRPASWHISIEADGTVVQMAVLTVGTWHAGSSTARRIAGVGWANRTSVGIELIGHGKEFPAAQVEAACRVWRAIVRAYGIERRYAMVTHAELDPDRRSDPGPIWMKWHAPVVLERAYAP